MDYQVVDANAADSRTLTKGFAKMFDSIGLVSDLDFLATKLVILATKLVIEVFRLCLQTFHFFFKVFDDVNIIASMSRVLGRFFLEASGDVSLVTILLVLPINEKECREMTEKLSTINEFFTVGDQGIDQGIDLSRNFVVVLFEKIVQFLLSLNKPLLQQNFVLGGELVLQKGDRALDCCFWVILRPFVQRHVLCLNDFTSDREKFSKL